MRPNLPYRFNQLSSQKNLDFLIQENNGINLSSTLPVPH